MTRRVLRGVLHDFLGSYASRNSDFDGWWLFGQIIDDIERVEIDLLGTNDDAETSSRPLKAATEIARARFLQQVETANLPLACIRSASLQLTRSTPLSPADFPYGGRPRYTLLLSARATTDLGRMFESARKISVDPHDPRRESRSGRQSKTSTEPG